MTKNKLWLKLNQDQDQLKLELVFFVASKVKSTDQKLDQQLKTYINRSKLRLKDEKFDQKLN